MTLIDLLLVILIIGFCAWAISLIPMPSPFKQIAQLVLVVILILWLLSGLAGHHFGLGLRLR